MMLAQPHRHSSHVECRGRLTLAPLDIDSHPAIFGCTSQLESGYCNNIYIYICVSSHDNPDIPCVFWLFTTNYLGPAPLLVAEAYWEDLGIQRRPNLRGLSEKLGVTTRGTSFPGHLNVEMIFWILGVQILRLPIGGLHFMGLLRQPYYSNRGFSRGFGHGV